MRRLWSLLRDPVGFLESARNENWTPAFVFFVEVTALVSIMTPIMNYVGFESTDFSSAYQAQIMAFRLVEKYLLPSYGTLAYVIEPLVIVSFACLMLCFLTVFLHAACKIMGGTGGILNAWKMTCYGVGPCILGGFLPYVALFAAFYSLLLQLYIGPRTLYRVSESRALVFLAIVIALAFNEMFAFGTTVIRF